MKSGGGRSGPAGMGGGGGWRCGFGRGVGGWLVAMLGVGVMWGKGFVNQE